MACLKKACRECPFKRDAAKGWLGESSWKPAEFLTPYEWHGEHLACHMQVDWDSDFLTRYEEQPTCFGYATYMRNQGKLPRNPEDAVSAQALSVNHEDFFSKMEEFVEHHLPEGALA